MNDFGGLLSTDYGFKKSDSRTSTIDDYDSIFATSSSSTTNRTADAFADVFVGPPKYASTSSSTATRGGEFDFDSMLSAASAPPPKYDRPVYDDDDIFDGVPGLKSSGAVKYDDVFASAKSGSAFDDLLGSLSGKKAEAVRVEKVAVGDEFDDLLPGFGGSSPRIQRQTSEASRSSISTADTPRTAPNMMHAPFVVIGSASPPEVSSPKSFTDPLEETGKFNVSESTDFDGSSVKGRRGEDMDPLSSLGKSVPVFSSGISDSSKERSFVRRGTNTSGRQTLDSKASTDKSSVRSPDNQAQRKRPVSIYPEFPQTMPDAPTSLNGFSETIGQNGSFPSYVDSVMNSQARMSPELEDNLESSDDVWLTVYEIPLFTQPTLAPPPSRPPPPRPAKVSKAERDSFSSRSARKTANDFTSGPNSTQYPESSNSYPAARDSFVSSIDQLEDFAMDRSRNNIDEQVDDFSGHEANSDAAASAAAMKKAMDRAEAKFRYAKEVKERENAKSARSTEAVFVEKDGKATDDAQEKSLREREDEMREERRLGEERERAKEVERKREAEEREQRKLERERERAREIEREREAEEREQRKLERERERAREIEREREKARQAVERATREARERAALEARLKAEKAAVEKANAEARQRAERAAVQRAQNEARARAAVEAKERAEKAAAEAKERAEKAAAEAKERAEKAAAEVRERENAEAKARAIRAEADARSRAERAAVERAAAEARQRAAAEARDRAATTAAKVNQQKSEDDFDFFFGMGARPSSTPKARDNFSDPLFDNQFQARPGPEVARSTSVQTSSNMRKASSTTKMTDDLSSIFGAPRSSGDFQEMVGETEERRRARLERHQRTQERAARALDEKNQRDLQVQRDQAERHRISETLDTEIKRWSAGKEGNLRALLSTLQYVLWPECGWQPVSLIDLINAASVKKVYRKATLCIHPDKVQQKGANLQQKYVAEKVFDLLKEAWNKFNSEELF